MKGFLSGSRLNQLKQARCTTEVCLERVGERGKEREGGREAGMQILKDRQSQRHTDRDKKNHSKMIHSQQETRTERHTHRYSGTRKHPLA